jgi:hypothetical protein
MAGRINLLAAQAAEARSKSCRAPRGGSLVAAQIALINAQIEHYSMDARAKKAQLFANMYSVSATQDIDLAGIVTASEASAQASQVSMTQRDIDLFNAGEDAQAAAAAAEGGSYTPSYIDSLPEVEEIPEIDIKEDSDCGGITFGDSSTGTTGGAGGATGDGTTGV